MSSILCNLTDYYCSDCIDQENGRVSAVAFVKRGAPLLDPSSQQAWKDVVCNGLAVIIPGVRGTYDGGAGVIAAGYGRVPSKRTGANHTVEYMHIWTAENQSFYNQANIVSGYDFYFSTESKLWHANADIFVDAKTPITDDVSSLIEFSVTISWSNTNLMSIYDVPVGIFDNCERQAKIFSCLTCNPIEIDPC